MNTIIGYISFDNKYGHTFKIKNNELKRHTGASCDQMNKDKKIQLLNDLAGYIKYKKYTKEEIAKEIGISRTPLREALHRHILLQPLLNQI